MRIIRYVGLHEEIRWWDAEVYYLPWSNKHAVALIGLHWLIKFVRWVWELFVRFRPSKLDQLLAEAYGRGRQDAKNIKPCGTEQIVKECQVKLNAKGDRGKEASNFRVVNKNEWPPTW